MTNLQLSKYKFLFIGLGSIGIRHLRALLALEPTLSKNILALRTLKGQEPIPPELKEIHTCSSWQEVEQFKPNIAFICNPTSMHIQTAIECAKRKMHLLIEKPLGSTADLIQTLIETCHKNDVHSYTAYVLRHHPGVVQLKEMISTLKNKRFHIRANVSSHMPAWRKNQDYKKHYSVSKESGGGVLLELSHDLDLISYIGGTLTNLHSNAARISEITKDCEDTIDIIGNAGKNPFTLHMNFFSHFSERKIFCDFEDQTFELDIMNSKLKIHKPNSAPKEISYTNDRDQLFQKQIEYFIQNIEKPEMMNSLKESTDFFKSLVSIHQHSIQQIGKSND